MNIAPSSSTRSPRQQWSAETCAEQRLAEARRAGKGAPVRAPQQILALGPGAIDNRRRGTGMRIAFLADIHANPATSGAFAYDREKGRFMVFHAKAVVIATGGGAPCFHENMRWMMANGVTIYLNTDEEVLFHRLKPEMAHRPLLKRNSEEELENFIASKLKERESFYRSSKFIIDTSELTADEIVRKIISLLA
jgi:hypothetical protein